MQHRLVGAVALLLFAFGCRQSGNATAGVKLVVLYPPPQDTAAFEQVYSNEHVPMVTPESFPGLTRFIASRVIATPDASAPAFYRIAELHFGSMGTLQAAMATPSAQRVAAHAGTISTGGRPLVLVVDENVKTF